MHCEYHLAIVDSFRLLCDALTEASRQLRDTVDLPCWMQPLDTLALRDPRPHTQAIRLLNQLDYLDGQEGREILLGVGIFAVRQPAYDALFQLNQAKAAFKYAIQNLKCQGLKSDEEALSHAFRALLAKTRHDDTHTSLHRSGLLRLHLKQCYRQIPLLKKRPARVSWCWANTRSIKRITASQAMALLEKKGSDAGILAQQEKVAALPPETPIAIVQALAPHLRTNIWMDERDNSERRMLKGSLPLFYLHEDNTGLPEIAGPKSIRQQTNRPTRSDVKINPEVFLPAIRGHLYSR